MFKSFLEQWKISTQIMAIVGLLYLTLFLIGAPGVYLLYESEELAKASTMVESLRAEVESQELKWKNLLIRGYDKQSYDLYWEEFQQHEQRAQAKLNKLEGSLLSMGYGGQALERFRQHFAQMGERYRLALSAFDPANRSSYLKADESVRGVDREAMQALDSVALKLAGKAESDMHGFSYLLIGLLGSIVLAVILIYRYSKSLHNKFDTIIQVTKKIAAGDLSNRIPISGDNELGVLSTAFNKMAESLADIVANAQSCGIQLSSFAVNMAATTKQQSAAAKEQEATVQEITASTREIAKSSKDLLGNMDEVAKVVDDAARFAEQGRTNLEQMTSTVKQMFHASQTISDKLAVLNQKAANINSVVTTINKIADQTNLLSINAAIEADKAGEYGLGFSTVSAEIRRLADQTAVSTYDIEEMVKEMHAAVSAGVMGMEKFSEEIRRGVEDTQEVNAQLNQIVERVQDLAPHFQSVHHSMKTQTHGAEQIEEALSQLGETIRSLNDSMRQSNGVIDDLNVESDRLQQSMMTFTLTA